MVQERTTDNCEVVGSNPITPIWSYSLMVKNFLPIRGRREFKSLWDYHEILKSLYIKAYNYDIISL